MVMFHSYVRLTDGLFQGKSITRMMQGGTPISGNLQMLTWLPGGSSWWVDFMIFVKPGSSQGHCH